MITEQIMAAGSFDVPLRPNTPLQVTDLCALASSSYGTLIITPTWVDGRQLTTARVLDMAIYCGVLTQTTDRVRLGGKAVTVIKGTIEA